LTFATTVYATIGATFLVTLCATNGAITASALSSNFITFYPGEVFLDDPVNQYSDKLG